MAELEDENCERLNGVAMRAEQKAAWLNIRRAVKPREGRRRAARDHKILRQL
jgi:hypothetical protein